MLRKKTQRTQRSVYCIPYLSPDFYPNESKITAMHVYLPYNYLSITNIYPPSDYMHE